MSLTWQLANLGAVVTLAFGIAGLFLPGKVARLVSITPVGRPGVGAIRATYGGLFAMLAVVVLLAQERALFGMVGAAWAGAATGRLFSMWRDESRETKNVAGFLLELGLGYLLLAPVLALWLRELSGAFG